MSIQRQKQTSKQKQRLATNPQYMRLVPDKQLQDGRKKRASRKQKDNETKAPEENRKDRPQSEVSWMTVKNRARKFQRDINSPSGFCYSAITSQSEAIYPIAPGREGKTPSVTFTYRDILRHLYKVWEPQLCRNYRPTVEYSRERDVLYKPDKVLQLPKGRRKLRAARAAIEMMNTFYAGSYYNPMIPIYAGQNTLDVPTVY